MKGPYGGKKREGNTTPSNGANRNGTGNHAGSGFFETEETTKAFNDRLNYLLVNSIGSEAVVTVTTGVKYKGLLTACNPDSANGIDVVLKNAKVIDKNFAVDQVTAELSENLVIKGEDVAELGLPNVEFGNDERSGFTLETASETIEDKKPEVDVKPETKVETSNESRATPKVERSEDFTVAPVRTTSNSEFKTDTDISGNKTEIKERKLQKWVPDGQEAFDIDEGLEDSKESWNQFAVNEEKFGIKSTFDEHLYTTRINKSNPNYNQRLKEADKIAKDIESQGSSGNIHLAEERGLVVDDSGIDEEDKYSGVDRRGDELLAQLKLNAKSMPTKARKYVPPTLRNQPHNNDPAIISSRAAGVPPPSNTSKPQETVSSEIKQPSQPAPKRNQLDELKEFSEKFKVPYDMPEEVKSMFKKSNENSPQSAQAALKLNPSLPPKPVSTSPVGATAATGTSRNGRASRGSTPSIGKADLKKVSGRVVQGQTPISSPSSGRHSNIPRRRNISQGSFLGSKGPQACKKDFASSFNMFLKGKETFEEVKKPGMVFVIEKPYFTAPTWMSTVEQSYKALFPDERSAMQRSQMRMQQRNMNGMPNAAAGSPQMMGMPGMMMGVPMGPNNSHNPYMMAPNGGNNMGGMYMPFQPPGFYPPVMQMMGMGEDRGAASPPANVGSPFNYTQAMQFQPMMGSGTYRPDFHNRHRVGRGERDASTQR
ncbi:LANO_0E13894g1_1 [Lachancea nothofagi CBS 11611]|uniref:LANO_0E13894g1_1 n=1 Tax=Lachancea nothofagi CBS 11611 TaxID=1266666 RepID=A0A1G4JZE1_9SACH|nr:LANO_0E13894g1_1 [Lachancea nothofagi CBS 11611]